MEYTFINYLFDKGETVSEGICFTSQSKVTGLKRESLFPNRAAPLFSSSRTGITDYQKKCLILNLINFFSGHFKKILNSQKFGNSFIFKLPKFCENT